MKLEHSFEVAAPLERVWNALIDVEYVAPCLPGAAVTDRDDDGAYRGSFTVKLGPTTAAYNGVINIGELDESAHKATLHARGTDKRGQGGATATIVNTVSDAGNGSTRVEAVTDFTITGRLARFGRGGMIEDISNRLLREFSDCLAGKLAAEAPPETSPGEAAPLPNPAPVPSPGAPETALAAASAATPSPPPPAPVAPPPVASAPAASGQTQPAAPVKGFSLFFSILWERIRKRVAAMRTGR